MFWPMDGFGEVDLRGLDEAARRDGKRVYYPFSDDGDVGFREVADVRSLQERGHGFLEPDSEGAEAVSGNIDLVLVPAIAVTESGHRLGFGRGFYDRLLPRFSPPATSIVVAFDFQLVVELPVEAHDVACDLVVTDRE
jgi:5-formyltetrahydrofolate cyclo-ligase